MDNKTITEEIEKIRWWHSIDFGNGLIAKGHKTPEGLSHELKSLNLPDLKGKSVLDIGAWDGFYSFEAERRGAKRVLALDHYVWSLDLPAHFDYIEDCEKRGIVPVSHHEQMPYWHPETLPGKRGFDLAHKILKSKVEYIVDDFMTMDLNRIGTFDIVFYFGVLYHMENPLQALRRVSAVAKEMVIIETQAIRIPGYEDVSLFQFFEANELNNDATNWWAPNEKALIGICRAAGFKTVDVMVGPPPIRTPYQSVKNRLFEFYRTNFKKTASPAKPMLIPNIDKVDPYRAMVHARK